MCVWRARFVQRHSRLIIFCTTRADMISKGNYPWAQSAGRSDAAAGGGSRTHAQLVTQLRMHVSEMERATEEKTRLEEERDRCLAYLTHQAGAVAAAVERARARQAALVERASDVPPCASQGSKQPQNTGEYVQEAMYNDGLLLLLEDRKDKASMQLLAAQSAFATAFASSGAGSAPRSSSADDSGAESDEEDEVL